jgi:hypothetical protein
MSKVGVLAISLLSVMCLGAGESYAQGAIIPGISCALPSLRADFAGIEYAETGDTPWIAVNARDMKVYRWKTEAAAFTGITKRLKKGYILAVGIAQIKNTEFKAYHVSLATALDPCGAAKAVSNAIQKNIQWAAGAGYGIGHRFAAAASGYTSGKLLASSPMVIAYVQRALYARQLYNKKV